MRDVGFALAITALWPERHLGGRSSSLGGVDDGASDVATGADPVRRRSGRALNAPAVSVPSDTAIRIRLTWRSRASAHDRECGCMYQCIVSRMTLQEVTPCQCST